MAIGLCLQVGVCLMASDAHAIEQSKEIQYLKSLTPYIAKWQTAIRKKDLEKAKIANEAYEAKWQGIEAYLNHRSLPLYRDMEVDTQFAIEDELSKENPNFNLMKKQIAHLGQDLKVALQLAKAGPQLSPLFDDLVLLRSLRGSTLLIIRDKLAASTPDTVTALAKFEVFKQGFPAVKDLIEFRSSRAIEDINAAITAAETVFSDPNATATQLTAANTTLINSFGFGLNLLNSAARAAVMTKTAITDTDKSNLTKLNNIKLALASGTLTAGATGPGSNFESLQTVLEGLGRSLNAVGTLRTALLAYDKAVQASPSNADTIARTQKSALQAVAITEQALVGQFWGTVELETFLAGLPNS